MDKMFVIAGLGNPGPQYINTRHNVGFDTVDVIADKLQININKIKHKALIGEGMLDDTKIMLVKPQTYMNSSGESIRDIVEWYKIPLSNLIIIYDDIDLDLGKIRIKKKGSSGTHNGMKSVIYKLQSEDFPRVRIGLGKPPEKWDLVNYVLGKFPPEERKVVDVAVKLAAKAVEVIINSGVEAAMNKYNSNRNQAVE